ncbi:MAG: thioesterase [Bacteroidales bacterium]|nr:thioesterase [Bacteroidales bacterium]
MSTYKENFTVKTYETDHTGKFKPTSWMYHMQEMANIHALSLGFGYDNLIGEGIAWVLSRIHVKFLKLPTWKDNLIAETWHKGSDRLFGFRDYKACDSSGETVILTTSSWLIINTNTRRLQRIDSVLGTDFEGSESVDAIKEPAERLVSPDGMELRGSVTVKISDIDINQHTNNIRYMEWAMNHINTELATKMEISELWINFNNECRLNDVVDIYVKEAEMVYIEGKRGETSVFQARIGFRLN